MSKDSSIKVFAENTSGTRPANAIPVWIDNISAIGGGGGGGNPEVESYVTDNSGKIDNVCTTYQTNSGSYLTAHQTIPSAKWEDASDCVQTNSASWAEGGSSDTFYIYPGKTTDKEISENSGKDMKLYNSANNTFLDYAGKSSFSNYAILDFKNISGTQYNFNTLQHLRLRVYPAATSACKIYQTASVSLLDSNSTISQAQTAYYDSNGNYLSQTHDNLTALNQFVQTNSANWEGGSSPTSDTVIFHKATYQPAYGGKGNTDSYIANASDLYFEASVYSNFGAPNSIIIEQNGSFVGEAYWTQVSSDGEYNYYSASYKGQPNSDYKLNNNGYDSYNWCYVSANGVRTEAFNQGQYKCTTNDTVKINVQGSNITGTIYGQITGNTITLTSFTGSLTDFTAKGCEQYNCDVFAEVYDYDCSYSLSAEFEGGSTVASSDVFPPTNNLDPYATYYLGWNANNGGLFWYQPEQGGN